MELKKVMVGMSTKICQDFKPGDKIKCIHSGFMNWVDGSYSDVIDLEVGETYTVNGVGSGLLYINGMCKSFSPFRFKKIEE